MDAAYAWVDNSVKMIASGDLFPDAIQSRVAARMDDDVHSSVRRSTRCR